MRILCHKPDEPYLDIYIIKDTYGLSPSILNLDGTYRDEKEGFEFKNTQPTVRLPTVDQTGLIENLIEALLPLAPKRKILTKEEIIKTIKEACYSSISEED